MALETRLGYIDVSGVNGFVCYPVGVRRLWIRCKFVRDGRQYPGAAAYQSLAHLTFMVLFRICRLTVLPINFLISLRFREVVQIDAAVSPPQTELKLFPMNKSEACQIDIVS